MTTIKFDHNAPPAYVLVQDFTVGVLGYWVSVGETQYRLSDGDYIIVDDNGIPSAYYSAAQYASDLVASNLIREAIGKELIRNIWAALLASGLTDAQKVGVANKIAVVIVIVQCGQITAARFLANTVTTDANFTAGVKTALLNLMDAAIAKL